MAKIFKPSGLSDMRGASDTAKLTVSGVGLFTFNKKAISTLGLAPEDRLQVVQGEDPKDLFICPIGKKGDGFQLASIKAGPNLVFCSAALRKQLIEVAYPDRKDLGKQTITFLIGQESRMEVEDKKNARVWPLLARAIV